MSAESVGREEPNAESRLFARGMRQLFVALQQEGFSTGEAIAVIGRVIAAGMKRDES